jgi:membrane protease YdiL (CAAX protease family)
MEKDNLDHRLKPMPLWLSFILFGVPGVFIYWGMYYGVPLLVQNGIPLVVSFALLSLPGIVLLIVSLVAYRLDGYSWNWAEFKKRFRLHAIKGKDWLWIIGIFLICTISDESLQVIGKWLATIPLFAPPDYLPPLFNPLKAVHLPLTEFLGVSLKGNWGILALWIPLNLFSMIGEEFMWRGYILPRQELAHGKWAWVVNGLMWAFLVHACMKWHYIGMLPSMLLTPWLAQRMKNTSASAIVHIGGNAILFWMLLLMGVLGIGG